MASTVPMRRMVDQKLVTIPMSCKHLDDQEETDEPAEKDQFVAINFFEHRAYAFSRVCFTEDAGGADEQHDDEDGEGDCVAHGGGDIRSAERFGLAHDQRADQRAGDAADAAQHRRHKGFQAGDDAHPEDDLGEGDGVEHAGGARQGRADGEGDRNDHVDVDAHQAARFACHKQRRAWLCRSSCA